MNFNIRLYCDDDLDAIVQLSLLAWKPVFHSLEQVLGHNIFALLQPDWRDG